MVKAGFYSKYFSSDHTFPLNRSSVNELIKETKVEDNPISSDTAVEESLPLNDDEGYATLCWEGFLIPVEEQTYEVTTTKLIVDGHGGYVTIPVVDDGRDNNKDVNSKNTVPTVYTRNDE